MRSHSEYIPLTQDQIALAQHTDIVEYLRERGEKVQKEGNHYIWEKHDSCVIHGYKWYQNSTGKRRCRSFCAKLLSQKLPARCA